MQLGDLQPADVAVQLLHGPVGAGEELCDPSIVTLAVAGHGDDGATRYEGSFECSTTGRYGLTVRVVPSHADLITPVELGRIVWAN